MIEISVTDSGIGIKQKDQLQLFQLFGFLDSSKALNSKGVGLGLHISKMITQQFGGDIICKSEYNVGTQFTFIMSLGAKMPHTGSIQRLFNPIKKNYKKIIVSKKQHMDKGSRKNLNLIQQTSTDRLIPKIPT